MVGSNRVDDDNAAAAAAAAAAANAPVVEECSASTSTPRATSAYITGISEQRLTPVLQLQPPHCQERFVCGGGIEMIDLNAAVVRVLQG